MATDPVSFIFGGNTGLTYEQLKRRRAVAAALAAQRRGFPKTVGEGMTYLGESIGDMIAERRLDAAEQGSAAYGANLRREIEGAAPATAPAAAPTTLRPPTPAAPARPPAPPAPAPARPAPAARPTAAATPVEPAPNAYGPPVGELTQGYTQFPTPSGEGMTSGLPPSEFAMGGILNAAPLAAPNLEATFPVEGGGTIAGTTPSSGYLPPTAMAAAPPTSSPNAPAAASPELTSMDEAGWPTGPRRDLLSTETAAPDAAPIDPRGSPQWQAMNVERIRNGQQPIPPPASELMRPRGVPQAAPAPGPQSINLTPQQRDVLARTIYGEASNQADVGQQAVANVILNRARMAGTTPDYEALKKNQFEPWWNARARARMERLSTEDPAYQRAQAAIDAALAGDPTGGATHFFSPTEQAKLGRQVPGWARGQPNEMIGTHAFYRIPYAGQQPGAPVDGQDAIQQALGGGVQVASYAPSGGVGGAPIPGMGGAGSPRLAPDESGATPVDIEPAPPTAQFGGGRFVRTDVPPPGIPPATPAPSVGPSGGISARPSQEPIPSATPQVMEPPSATPPPPPGPRPRTPAQQRILQALGDPRLDPNGPDATVLKDRFAQDEAERQRLEKIDYSNWTSQRERWEKDTADYKKFERERTEREIKQLGERQAIEDQRLKMEGERQKQKAGQAPTHATMNDVPVQWDQESGTWKEIKVQRQPSEGGPPSVKLTKEQSDELQHLTKVRIALDQYNRVRDADKILAEGLKDELAGKLPFFGNAALSEKYRVVRNAASNFLQGHLRSTSGAAIGAQEMASHYSSLVPLYGDDPVTIKNKQQQREGIAQGMYVGLGTARPLFDYSVQKRQEEDTAEQARIRREMPTNPEVGKIYKNEKGRRRYWTGSRWEDD